MGAPVSLLGNARAFARDFPRDRMPQGYLWDVVDYVPTIIDASLTGRGGWQWGSTALSGDVESGIYAPFSNGDKLLVQTADGRLFEVSLASPYTATDRGALPRSKQNPVQLVDTVVHFDMTSSMPPRLITNPGGVPTVGAIATGHKNAPVGAAFKSMLITAGAPGELNVIRFSDPQKALTDPASYVDNSFYATSLPITAIAALRSVILIFHDGSVERIRGATPAHGTAVGDMILEPLFDRAGCIDPQSIAYWNDNCVFADAHGVHITDGSVIRNLVSQGGILYYWRQLYENKIAPIAGCTFLDYYICTLRRSDSVYVTLICDLNRRQWVRFTNILAYCYIASSGGSTMERVWAGMSGKARLARIAPCFFPTFSTATIQDDDGSAVLPVLETPWYRLGQEGRKRVRFGYLSYDVRTGAPTRDGVPSGWRFGGEETGVPLEDGVAATVASQILQVGYIRSPQQASYTTIGTLPDTAGYSRYRLPLGQNPYGLAFKVTQLLPSTVTRIFDLAVEAQAGERSRT